LDMVLSLMSMKALSPDHRSDRDGRAFPTATES
jgi:hypothetical protein